MDLRQTLESGAEWLRKAFAPAVAEINAWVRPETGEVYVAVRKDHDLRAIAGPERARARHEFADVSSFADWLNRHAANPLQTEIAIAADGAGCARVGIDDPRADYVALAVPLDPTLQAFRDHLGRELSQRELQQLVRGYGDAITKPTAGALLTMLGTLKVATKDAFESHIDETGATRFAGRMRDQTVEGTVPPTLTLRTPFFQGVQAVGGDGKVEAVEKVYEVELCVSFDHDGPSFVLTAPGWARLERQAVLDLKAFLEALLAEGFLVGLGMLKREVVRCPRPAGDGD